MLRNLLVSFGIRCLCLLTAVSFWFIPVPAIALSLDNYIIRYLHITEPIALNLDDSANKKDFSPVELSEGKRLFEANCINCHVGGATLPEPEVSLALNTLQAANPPRSNINSLVKFMRQPMTYDGSEETFWCRQMPASLLSQQQIENLAAFVLTAAQKAPGWGTESF